tara:strand:- start:963 stop:1289 length:327 start_codon:yes stop_codon:yes gene_type:complete
MTEKAVVVPTWLAPSLLGVVILVTGAVVRNMAAEEADALDTRHLSVVRPDIMTLERNVSAIQLKQAKYDADIVNIQKAVDISASIAAENHTLIIRIAAKLDVDNNSRK